MAAPIPLPIPPTSKANHPSSTPDSAYYGDNARPSRRRRARPISALGQKQTLGKVRVRFVPKADIPAASILLNHSHLPIGATLVDDSRCGRFLFDRFCDDQHRNLSINLALAEMGDGHGRETPPRKSVVVLSISRWPLAE